MLIGLICSIFTILCSISIFIFNKKTKKIFGSYWFYAITSFIAIIYFVIFRWIDDIKSWIDNNDNNYLGGMSVVKSKVLLLDMCPFLAFFLPIILIFDRKRILAPSIAYFAIVGGGITIFGQIMFEKIGLNGDYHLINTAWWEYIFLNKLYFLMHFYIFIIALIIIMNSKSLNWYKVIYSHIYAILFFAYVSIMIFTLDIKWNATGLVENDWSTNGQYSVLGSIINLPWPSQPIISFLLVWIWILLMMSIRNIMVLDKDYIDPKQINLYYFRNKYLYLYNLYKGKKCQINF